MHFVVCDVHVLVRSGVGLVHLQELLGHADPKLTSRVYTHLGVSELREALERGGLLGAVCGGT